MSDSQDGSSARQKHRYGVLKVLHDAYELSKAPSPNQARMTGAEITDAVKLLPEDVYKALEYLKQERLIEFVPNGRGFDDFLYSITHAGLIEMGDSFKNPNKDTQHFERTVIHQYLYGSNSQALSQVGNQNKAELVQNINSDPEILKLLEQLYQQVELFPTTVQDAVTETLDIIRTEANKPVPVRSRLQMAFSSLWNFGRDIATFADSVLAIAEKFGITPDLFQ